MPTRAHQHPTSFPADWLFHPGLARQAVVARRPAGCTAVQGVVSDVVWGDVVRLVRWAVSAQRSAPEVAAGAWWRLAVDSAGLLRRLPALMDEAGERWVQVPDVLTDDATPAEQAHVVAAGLVDLLLIGEPVPLTVVAREVARLGAAAISASAASTDWTAMPR